MTTYYDKSHIKLGGSNKIQDEKYCNAADIFIVTFFRPFLSLQGVDFSSGDISRFPLGVDSSAREIERHDFVPINVSTLTADEMPRKFFLPPQNPIQFTKKSEYIFLHSTSEKKNWLT